MILFDGAFVQVRQGFFTGWKILDKMSGATCIPNSLLKERIGLTWMLVRRTKRQFSKDGRMSEEMMFGSFAKAAIDPSGQEGQLWTSKSPDELSNLFIATANHTFKEMTKGLPK